MERPLLIDLFAGSFAWSAGWLEMGGRVVGFDLEHEPHHGPVPPGADLVLQDVRTIDGARFKDAALIVSSSPCQEFSYRAMPWKRAKALGPPLLGLELFAQAFRIQREAIAAAGHFIPMVQENVRGANPWVREEFGRSRWSYGSYHLWGDVPALMPIPLRIHNKIESPHLFLRDPKRAGGKYAPNYTKDDATKNSGGSWYNVAHNTTSGTGQNLDGRLDISEGRKGYASGTGNLGKSTVSRTTSSKSSARKAASARIARIPLALSRHIARTYFPLTNI